MPREKKTYRIERVRSVETHQKGEIKSIHLYSMFMIIIMFLDCRYIIHEMRLLTLNEREKKKARCFLFVYVKCDNFETAKTVDEYRLNSREISQQNA